MVQDLAISIDLEETKPPKLCSAREWNMVEESKEKFSALMAFDHCHTHMGLQYAMIAAPG
eukprot:CAMPEP_0184688134 /NCGR_PEP_ID=MMETSP0312-20130426/28673_1 /TAXON_ID=31354 /ORGANISM="Compsopogon coeruleus, Strain SAG 36.94" /LENGTH=59 /DNA_ID=CAMNT_0027144941 /DNA_START=72 /DNA_END=247 /DNA_ORIENTATION=+